MDSLSQDVRYACRSLAKARGFLAIAVLSLAIGIGANTTIFSVFNRFSAQPIPFHDPGSLAVIFESNPGKGMEKRVPTSATARAIREHSRSFQKIGLASGGNDLVNLSGDQAQGRDAEKVPADSVDPYFFETIGVKAAIGRTFRPEDCQNSGPTPILLSHGFWQRRLNGDGNVLERTIRVNGNERPIIGVMPAGFWAFPWAGTKTAFWQCVDMNIIPKSRWMVKFGRLQPGVTREAAAHEATPIVVASEQAAGEDTSGLVARMDSVRQAYFEGFERFSLYLLATVGFVLLIACANVANLVLARGAARQSELTIRASLGAGRWRIIRQMLIESLLVSIAGGIAGVFLAIWGKEGLVKLAPSSLQFITEAATIDIPVLVFTACVCLAATIVFGLWPAVRTSRVCLNDALKSGQRSGASREHIRGRATLLVAEIALAMVLLVGAGAVLQGLVISLSAHPGFQSDHVLTGNVLLSGKEYFEAVAGDRKAVTPQTAEFYGRLLEKARALPGVDSTGMISRIPLQSGWPKQPFAILGRPPVEKGREPQADYVEVDSQLFTTLKVPLLRGRAIEESDNSSSPWVAVVNRTFADRHFANQDPIGQMIRISIFSRPANQTLPEEQARRIVGVVDSLRYPSWEREPVAAVYISYKQHPREYPGGDHTAHIGKTIVVRTKTQPLGLAPALKKAVTELDPDQLLENVMTADELIAQAYGQNQFMANIFAGFATLALLLAAVGIFGVTSYLVTSRVREFGIRIALGADRESVLRLVLSHVVKLTALGILLGAAGGYALQRILQTWLPDVPPVNFVTWSAVFGVMFAVALGAAVFPALRATRTDPMTALRHE
jgi:putative ABC transport system permease protein